MTPGRTRSGWRPCAYWTGWCGGRCTPGRSEVQATWLPLPDAAGLTQRRSAGGSVTGHQVMPLNRTEVLPSIRAFATLAGVARPDSRSRAVMPRAIPVPVRRQLRCLADQGHGAADIAACLELSVRTVRALLA